MTAFAACASSATSASTRRCTRASSARAATIVVTMDGDLQNPPEDMPKLIAAVESGYDVASGRRVARRDSWGRTLPSRLINGMLRRFTGVDISDFGCAFNAYRRDAVEPMLGAIGKQKFTKALVLSTGASVVEVDVGHAARADSSRYSPLRLMRTALHVSWPASGRSRSSGSASRSASSARCGAFALGCCGIFYWIDRSNFPGPLFGGVAILFVLGVQGFILALVGEYLGQNPARRRRPPALHDRARTVASACSSPAGRGSSRRTSSATCWRRRRTRSSRSTRSRTPATSRTSPT